MYMGPQPRFNFCYYDLTFMYLELIIYPYYVFFSSFWPRFIVLKMFCLVYHIRNAFSIYLLYCRHVPEHLSLQGL